MTATSRHIRHPGLSEEAMSEPLLLVGSCNGWDASAARKAHRFLALSDAKDTDQRRFRLRMLAPAAPLVFQVISAKRLWDWRVYPRGVGDVPHGYTSRPVATGLACGEDAEAARDKNFVIGEVSSSAVAVHILLSKHIGIRLWYEEDAGIGLGRQPMFKPAAFLTKRRAKDGLEKHLDNAAIEKLNQDGFLVLSNVLPDHLLASAQKEANKIFSDGLLMESMQKGYGRTDKYVFLSEAQCAEAEFLGLEAAVGRLTGLARLLNLKTGCAGPELQRRRGDASAGEQPQAAPSRKQAVPLRIPETAMLATYDGHGTRYAPHRDNAISTGVEPAGDAAAGAGSVSNLERNARHLTLVLYLNNKDWRAKDGGALRCHLKAARWAGELTAEQAEAPPDQDGCSADCTGPEGTCHCDIQPRGGQLVIFFSRELLHEVRPAWRRRWAISLWVEDARIEPEDPEKTRRDFAKQILSALTKGMNDADKEQFMKSLSGKRPTDT
mmetsp:Transcript_126454/g.224085  ORF Transcript_126454/g.224085 Transcript_126454/m.224085 type:complete len:494 (-) Transcript_126454:170-1651(-)